LIKKNNPRYYLMRFLLQKNWLNQTLARTNKAQEAINFVAIKGIMKKLLALAVVVLAGCGAVTRSTGAMKLGPDTYRIAVRASMGDVGKSQQLALNGADEHCLSLKKELLVIGTRRLEDVGGGPFEVTFRCLDLGDSELKRPDLQPTPTSIIQMK
jgi:hypothetical protein